MRSILLEITMDQALKALNIDKMDARDASKLKSAYKAASLKNHPDRGGSTEAMKDVNLAYELLSKFAGGSSTSSSSGPSSSKFDWEASRKEYIELGFKVLEILKSTFKIQNFVDHFSKIYSKPFQYKITREWPKQGDRDAHYAGMDVEFFDGSRDIVFKLNFSCYLIDAKYNKSIGGGYGNISYPLGVSAYGFFNNKKLKITQRDYQRTTDHDVLVNPELAFPSTRLNKFKSTASSKLFRKEDMILTLKNKIDGGEWNRDQFGVRLGDDKPRRTLAFNRMTFQRMPYWTISYFVGGKYEPVARPGVLAETEDTAKFLIDLANGAKKTTPDQTIAYLNREIAAHKNEG